MVESVALTGMKDVLRFANGQWLWGVVAVLVLAFIFIWDDRKRKKDFERFADPRTWRALIPEFVPGARARRTRWWLLGAVFLCLALARPQFGFHEETVQISGLDIVFAIDLSNSMMVEDVVPNRLKKAKHFIRSFGEQLQGDRVGIVAFAGSAYVACPLTTDIGYVNESLEILSPLTIQNQGTDIGTALEVAMGALNRGAEEVEKNEQSDQASRVIILLTDGEDLEGEGSRQAKQVKTSGGKLYVLGVGTEKGGPIPMRDENGQLRGYKKDRSNQPVVSALVPKTLQDLANQGGGKFWILSESESEVSQILNDLGRDMNSLTRSDFSEKKRLIPEDRFQWPLGLAILFFILEMASGLRGASRKKTKRLVVAIALAIGSMFGGAWGVPNAGASTVSGYLKNRDGLKALESGKAKEAGQLFEEAKKISPNTPELDFNSGVAGLASGEPEGIEHAADAFGRSAKEFERLGRMDSAAQSYFNLGHALTAKKDLDQAALAYLHALDTATQAKDSELQSKARKNLELLTQEREKQKQEQKSKDQQDNKSDKNQDKQDSKENQKNDQDQKNKKDPQSKDENPSDQDKNKDQGGQENKPNQRFDAGDTDQNKEFKSKKLSKDDAARVMSELSNRERELQNRLKNKKGVARGADKDW